MGVNVGVQLLSSKKDMTFKTIGKQSMLLASQTVDNQISIKAKSSMVFTPYQLAKKFQASVKCGSETSGNVALKCATFNHTMALCGITLDAEVPAVSKTICGMGMMPDPKKEGECKMTTMALIAGGFALLAGGTIFLLITLACCHSKCGLCPNQTAGKDTTEEDGEDHEDDDEYGLSAPGPSSAVSSLSSFGLPLPPL